MDDITAEASFSFAIFYLNLARYGKTLFMARVSDFSDLVFIAKVLVKPLATSCLAMCFGQLLGGRHHGGGQFLPHNP